MYWPMTAALAELRLVFDRYWYSFGGDTEKAIKYMLQDMEVSLKDKGKNKTTKKRNTIK